MSRVAARQPEIPDTEKELLEMDRCEVIIGLNNKQQRFCEEYTRTNNVRIACKLAGYSVNAAHAIGWKLRQKVECARYIAWLKARIANECCIKGAEIVDQYIRIAFADITDFLEKDKYKRIRVKDIDMLDGQIITKLHQRASGFTLELADKMKALEKLERYFEFMPKDWRQDIEERRTEIMEKRLELERFKVGQIDEDEIFDDGFIEALKDTTESVWEEDIELEDN